MVAWFFLGVCLLVATLLAARWFATADPHKLARGVRWTAAILVGLLALYLVFGGRLALAGPLALLVPIILRWRRGQMPGWGGSGGPSSGQASEISTAYLRLRLDHDSGDMTGVVLKGRFLGRELGDLALDDLLALLAECRAADTESARLLEAYMDRAHGAGWRHRDSAGAGARPGPKGTAEGPMTRDQAHDILGLAIGASDKEIKAAHRRLMKNQHPDHGGSTYLAAKINQAKDFLLSRKS